MEKQQRSWDRPAQRYQLGKWLKRKRVSAHRSLREVSQRGDIALDVVVAYEQGLMPRADAHELRRIADGIGFTRGAVLEKAGWVNSFLVP